MKSYNIMQIKKKKWPKRNLLQNKNQKKNYYLNLKLNLQKEFINLNVLINKY